MGDNCSRRPFSTTRHQGCGLDNADPADVTASSCSRGQIAKQKPRRERSSVAEHSTAALSNGQESKMPSLKRHRSSGKYFKAPPIQEQKRSIILEKSVRFLEDGDLLTHVYAVFTW